MMVLPVRAEEITLLMVPRDDGPVRIGMDVGNRFPTILLNYMVLPDGSCSLHGWTGSEWVNVSAESFTKGSFFLVEPASALIVTQKDGAVPESLIPPEAWCPSVYRIKTDEVRPLLHLIGRHYDFQYKDWKWFSENYKLTMSQINPEELNLAWYHKRLGENLKDDVIDGSTDLDLLEVIRTAQPDLEEQAEPSPQEPEVIGEPDEADTSAGDQIDGNPLDDPVLPAVIVSGGDGEEEPVPETEEAGIDLKSEEEE